LVFWLVTSCELLRRYQRLEETYFFTLQTWQFAPKQGNFSTQSVLGAYSQGASGLYADKRKHVSWRREKTSANRRRRQSCPWESRKKKLQWRHPKTSYEIVRFVTSRDVMGVTLRRLNTESRQTACDSTSHNDLM
jgi:hypothetical protein